MADYMVRATAANAQIRAFAATTRELVETARQAHNTSPVVTAALGRLLTAGVMMGGMLKGESDLLTLQVRGDGPVRGLTVTANEKGEVKGYPEVAAVILPANEKGKLDVGGAVGKGTLSVIRDLGLKEPYVGQTALVTGEIGDDLTRYFAESEQTPSSVGLGVLMEKNNTVRCAGGFIVQLMPFAEEETIARLEQNLSRIHSVTALLDQGMAPEALLGKVLEGFDLELTGRTDCRFACGCSRERVEKALISIGKKELREMITEGKPIEVNCHFCGKHYAFDVKALKELEKKCSR
ncbi:MAG: Hsp33 family molecular chaperone HslO [Eubacteriales bacterium]|nr:Hsp33 family molecular chaperone HslO [Eubacteriales bacterium]